LRLDKFLKVTRLIKRRTVANDMCHAGHVVVNGRPAKPGLQLSPGDIVTVDLGPKRLRVEVLAGAAGKGSSRAEELFRTLGETAISG